MEREEEEEEEEREVGNENETDGGQERGWKNEGRGRAKKRESGWKRGGGGGGGRKEEQSQKAGDDEGQRENRSIENWTSEGGSGVITTSCAPSYPKYVRKTPRTAQIQSHPVRIMRFSFFFFLLSSIKLHISAAVWTLLSGLVHLQADRLLVCGCETISFSFLFFLFPLVLFCTNPIRVQWRSNESKSCSAVLSVLRLSQHKTYLDIIENCFFGCFFLFWLNKHQRCEDDYQCFLPNTQKKPP